MKHLDKRDVRLSFSCLMNGIAVEWYQQGSCDRVVKNCVVDGNHLTGDDDYLALEAGQIAVGDGEWSGHGR